MASVWSLLKTIVKQVAVPTPPSGSSRRQSQAAINAPVARKLTEEQQILDKSMSWLGKRWAKAKAEEGARTGFFPSWYFEHVTERQLRKIEGLGLQFPAHASRGQFSDVIGLFDEPDDDDLAKLKFFGVKLVGKDRNESRVRHEMAIIDADPDSARRWSERPASALQLEFFKFHGLAVPRGLIAHDAERLINQELNRIPEARRDLWGDFCDVVSEFNDAEFRDGEGIRKPSLSKLRDAFDAVAVNSASYVDASDVATYLLERHPELARNKR